MSLGLFDRICLRLGRAALLVLVASVPFLVAEGVARVLYDPPPVRRVWDPFAYRIPQPGLEEEFTGPEGDRVRIRLNELGMRGPSIAEPVTPGTLTLVFLGGSTTENYHLPREATFPELIGERLATRTARPVRVFNAGMSAATTGTSLARLQHQLLELGPSVVVVLHAINDLMSGFHPRYRSDGRHLERPAVAQTRPRSYLYHWFRHRTTPAWSPGIVRASITELPSLPVFRRNLLSMTAIAGAHEVPILFLTQAHMYRADLGAEEEARMRTARSLAEVVPTPPDFASLERGMARFNSAILKLADESGSPVFDLAEHVPRSPEMIFDDCHLTRAGNQRVAEILTPEIERLLPLPPG